MPAHPIKSPRKLIEVALPLDAINEEAALRKRKAPGGYPTALHKWWAQRPPAAARAVIFAQLVNDPGFQQGQGFKYGVNKQEAGKKRQELFKIIEDLVLWENTNNDAVLERARAEILLSWREVCELNKVHPRAADLFNPERLPSYYDPFGGSGGMPLEAQRLGATAYSSDLNPVAVLINKAMIEIPPKFAGRPPVNPATRAEIGGGSGSYPGATGLAEDVRHYGAWMRAEAEKRIGHLYPPVEITAEMARERPDLKPLVGQKLTVIAWLWARTVKSPNPAFSHVDVPLASSFILSSKEGKESYVLPVVEGDRYRFTVQVGTPPPEAKAGTKLARGANFRCVLSDAAIEPTYIKAEGIAKRMGARLMAVVAEGARGRVYLSPSEVMEAVAAKAQPTWKPELSLPDDPRNFWTLNYGLTTFGDLFTPRQLVALTTFSDLVGEARTNISQDSRSAGMIDDGQSLENGGTGSTAYADAVACYLTLALGKLADYNNTLCTWNATNQNIGHLFTKQAIPMTWDYPETTPLATGLSFDNICSGIAQTIATLPASRVAHVSQADCCTIEITPPRVFSMDPPYYDTIGYADLSDFFYVWLRVGGGRSIFPSAFSTIETPKKEELVATPYRHGGKANAEAFFMSGIGEALARVGDAAHPAAPITIYYAFKQSETAKDLTVSTGWATFLTALVQAQLTLVGTWPMRTERAARSVGIGTNALASSIILVCRKRPADAPTISRREFIRELNAVLPEALDEMTKGSADGRSPVAPVDLSQAIIGPGMAVFSKYAAVLEADGTPMSVRTALQLINRFLAEDDFDADTQWCLAWFAQHEWKEGLYGEADVLARSKSISVGGLTEAGVVASGGGRVRLLKWADYPADWDPRKDPRQPVWETLHHLIRALKQDGEGAAGKLLGAVKSKSEATRQLAYRLYTLCERQGWAEDARAYNELITSWTAIESAAGQVPEAQGELFQ